MLEQSKKWLHKYVTESDHKNFFRVLKKITKEDIASIDGDLYVYEKTFRKRVQGTITEQTITCQETLAEAAVRVENIKSLSLLLEHGFTPTHEGIQAGDAMQQHPCVLLTASINGKVAMVELLLQYSANPNCKHSIMQAGKKGTLQEEYTLILPEVVKKLIDNVRNDQIYEYTSIVKHLMNYGIHLDLSKVKEVYTVIRYSTTLSVVKALQSDFQPVILMFINCGLIGLPPKLKKLFGILDIRHLKTEETKAIEAFLEHSILAGKKISFILQNIERHKKSTNPYNNPGLAMICKVQTNLILQDIARITIRRQLVKVASRQSILPLILKLPLPHTLKVWLSFDSLQHYKEPIYLKHLCNHSAPCNHSNKCTIS